MGFVNFKTGLYAVTLLAISFSLHADETHDSLYSLESITVTAEKQPEDLNEVPQAVSVVSSERVRNLTLRELEDVAAYVPNLHISQNGTQFGRLFIRKIGSGLNPGFEQSVGTFVDGIYAGRERQAAIPLLDVERIEVLKGPQGILFGKNTTAGAINVVTAKPADQFGSRLSTFYAPDHGEAFAEAFVTGPFAEGFAGRLAARISHLDGYPNNTALQRREPQNDAQMIRGSLFWNRFENLEIDTKYEYGHFRVKGLTSQIVDPGIFGPAFRANDPEFDSLFDTYRSSSPDNPLFGPDKSDTRYHNAVLSIQSRIGANEFSATTVYNRFQALDLLDLDYSAMSLLGAKFGVPILFSFCLFFV